MQAEASPERGFQVETFSGNRQLRDRFRAQRNGHDIERRRGAEVQFLPGAKRCRHAGLGDLGAETRSALLSHGNDERARTSPGVPHLVHALIRALTDDLDVVNPALGDAPAVMAGAQLVVYLVPATDAAGMVVNVGRGMALHLARGFWLGVPVGKQSVAIYAGIVIHIGTRNAIEVFAGSGVVG